MKIFKEALKFLGIFILYIMLNEVISSLFLSDLTSADPFLSNLARITVLMISMTIFIIIFKDTLFKDLFKLKKSDLDIGFRSWTIGLTVMIVCNMLVTLMGGSLAENEATNRELINNYLPYALVGMCIFAPIVEELMFRKSVRNIASNKYVYIILSGLLFGTLHILNELASMDSYINLLYLVSYSALGVSFAYTYYKTNNIWSTIIFHSIHNGIAIITVLVRIWFL